VLGLTPGNAMRKKEVKGQQTRTGHVAGIGFLFFLNLVLVFFLGVLHAGRY